MEEDREKVKIAKGLMTAVGMFAFVLSAGSLASDGVGRYTFIGLGLATILFGYALRPEFLAKSVFGTGSKFKFISSVLVIIGGLIMLMGEVFYGAGN